jgi:hypothetical protein
VQDDLVALGDAAEPLTGALFSCAGLALTELVRKVASGGKKAEMKMVGVN